MSVILRVPDTQSLFTTNSSVTSHTAFSHLFLIVWIIRHDGEPLIGHVACRLWVVRQRLASHRLGQCRERTAHVVWVRRRVF